MCGINGFNFKNKKAVSAMNVAIKHRGPDDSGSFVSKGVTLGQVRLSILDLSKAGHQPLFYDKKIGASNECFKKIHIKKSHLSIVFNGEVYNYIEIKEELQEKGYRFTTGSDTEVILASYQEWGTNCVKKFNGMWAFCIYDQKKNIFFLSRDRLGQKPLYYYYKNEQFIFSSEIKGILAHKNLHIQSKENLNGEAIELYFALGYIPAPQTIYKDIFKLEARHNLVFDLKKKIIVREQYWDLPHYKPINNKKALIKEGRSLLKSSISLRMRSDVSVGGFLSGGLDSSAVVGTMRHLTDPSKLHTFSIGFKDKKLDETPYINIVKDSFKTNHHHYYYTEKDFQELFKKYSWLYDEPFADFAGYPQYRVSEMAKEQVTVCLSGDGGDEIFGGYTSHMTGNRLDLLFKLPKPIRKIITILPAKKKFDNYVSFYLLKDACKLSLKGKAHVYSDALTDVGIKPMSYRKWAKEKMSDSLKKGKNHLGEAMRIYDLLYNTLPDNFNQKVDRASMAHALEVRSPFLDYRFAEFAQKIPTYWKQDLKKTKKLMREIIKDIVPEEIVTRGKQGFEPPIAKWLMKKEYDKNILKAADNLEKVSEPLGQLFKSKILKQDNNVYRIYRIRLFIFNEWWNQWIN